MGYFPHGFNTKNNGHYIAPSPDLMYYHPEYTKIVNRKGNLDFSEHQKLVIGGMNRRITLLFSI